MLYNLYNFIHDTLGMHFWTPFSTIVVIIMVVVCLVHLRNQKKREKNFEKKMQQHELVTANE